MKLKNILFICIMLLCSACEETAYEQGPEPQEEAVNFQSTTQKLTRADEPSALTMDGIRIIAPGYGTGAPNQSSNYKSETGVMSRKTGEDIIRWSAKNMSFTSWHPVTGLTAANDGTGTVDFTKDLEDFIGAHSKKEYNRGDLSVALEYKHLVVKFKITLKNIANDGTPISSSSSIIFPAIKQTGLFKADLLGIPTVSLGKAGNELEFRFTVTDGVGELTCYMPPMTETELLMYGSFTVIDGNTTYVGTLKNLGVPGINSGDYLTFDIKVNDDHTALLQAVTLAPWEVNSKNIYNRPSRGIWGLEDLQALSKLINGKGVLNDKGKPEWNNLTIDSLVNDKGVINLYTNIEFEEDDEFAPIGTEDNPFTGYTFNGNGYTVSKVVLKNSASDNQGLFGVVGDDAVIKNLTVKKALIEGKDNVGALVGKTIGSGVIIDHCFTSEGEVMGEGNTGGLIGYCAAGTLIRNCGVATSSISGNTNVGGFVGLNEGVIGNSYSNTGSLICYGVGGGFVGNNQHIIRNTYSCASFSHGTDDCGAVAGHHEPGKVMDNCYWNTECINNTSCSEVVGNSGVNDDGIEKKPNGFSGGLAFNKSNGHIINNGYIPLYDRLNDYINTYPNVTESFLRWAKINGVDLPVFGY